MLDNEYFTLAETVLATIEDAVEVSGVDIDCERSGNILTLGFANGSKIIINLQVSMHEIWFAAKAGGFHYRYQNGAWRNTRDGTELLAALSKCMSEQAEEVIKI